MLCDVENNLGQSFSLEGFWSQVRPHCRHVENRMFQANGGEWTHVVHDLQAWQSLALGQPGQTVSSRPELGLGEGRRGSGERCGQGPAGRACGGRVWTQTPNAQTPFSRTALLVGKSSSSSP